MADADSGVTLAARRKRKLKRKSPKRQQRQQAQAAAQPLPEPIQVETLTSAAKPSEPEKTSLLASAVTSLKSAFLPSKPEVAVGSSEKSAPSSIGGSAAEPLPPETEAALKRIPDRIEDPVGGELDAAEFGSDDLREMIESVDFEEQDVKDLLAELFDYLAEKFKSDHWRLTERQMRLLGGPTSKMANLLWIKFKKLLPDLFEKWLTSIPGFASFALACGIVVVPKVRKQWAITREAKKRNVPIERLAEEVRKKPAAAAAVAINEPGAFGIPEASGMIGGN